MHTLTGTSARHRRDASPHTRSMTDAVLTAEGRVLLERKAAALRTEIVPALLRDVADDVRDEQTRAVYDDSLHELLRLEALLSIAGSMPRPRGRRPHQVTQGDLITVAFLPAGGSGGPDGPAIELVEQYRLVHPVEAPLDSLRISVTSPLGQAVLGRFVGDVVELSAPAGRQIVQILTIEGSI